MSCGELSRAVHLQSGHRRAAHGRDAIDFSRFRIKEKVVFPAILSWMVEPGVLRMAGSVHVTRADFRRLHARHASAKLSSISPPPNDLGNMCSTSNGKLKTASGARQYSQRCPARAATNG